MNHPLPPKTSVPKALAPPISAPKLSVVLPCLNEGSHLDQTLGSIVEQLSFLDGDFELVVIDDGSSDHTWDVIGGFDATPGRIRGYKLSRRFGKELALTAGLEHASGRAIVVMDADLQHPPEMIAEMVRLWESEDYEIVEAVKEERGTETLSSKLGAGAFGVLHRWICKIDLQGASDFKLMDRKVLDAWASMPERNVFFRGMNAWLGFRRIKLPFTVAERVGGQTHWSQIELVKLALTGITAYSSMPLHLVTWMGVVFFGFAVSLGIFTMIAWFSGEVVEGFTTVILLQLIIASMIMLSLGILGTYVSRIYEEVKGRPRYILSETTHRSRTDPQRDQV